MHTAVRTGHHGPLLLLCAEHTFHPVVIAGEQHKGLTTLMQQLPFRLFLHQVVLLLLFFLQHCFDFADLFIWPEGSRQTRWHVGLQEALAWLSRPQDRHLSRTCLVVPLVPLVPSCVRRRLQFWLAAALGNTGRCTIL